MPDAVAAKRSNYAGIPLPGRKAALLIAVTLLVMGRVCFNGFVAWDDDSTIRQNTSLLPPTLVSLWHQWTTPSLGLYTPLTNSLWAIISWCTQFSDGHGHIVQAAWAFHGVSRAANYTADLGVLLLQAGRPAEAIDCLKAAHALDPTDSRVAALLHRVTIASATTQ